MEPDEEDGRINSSTTSVTEPEIAGYLDMTTTQAQSDAAPQSAVVGEKFEEEFLCNTSAAENQATMVSMQEEEDKEVVANLPEGKDRGFDVEGGGVISGEESQLAVKESEASEGKGCAGDNQDAGGGGSVCVSEETKEEGVVEAAEVVREVAVTAVSGGAANTQVLEECHLTVVQDGDELGEKSVAEETLDSREQGGDDVSKKADASEPMDIHEEKVKMSTETSGVTVEEAKEVDDPKSGVESDIAVAVVVDDNAAHGATKEGRMGNSEDGHEAAVAEVAGVSTTESNGKVDIPESDGVIEEETEEVDDNESGEENDITVAAEVGDMEAHCAMEEVKMASCEDYNEVVETEVADVASTGDDNEVEMTEAAGGIKERSDMEVGDTEAGEENDIAVAAEVCDNTVHSASEDVILGNSEDDSDAMVAGTKGDDNEEEMDEAAEGIRVINPETDAIEEIDRMEEMEKVVELCRSSGGQKRKRGGSKGVLKVASKLSMEEDVCFICFDGGDLVLCDRRKCPKAYHPSCVDRDEAFFRTKGQWFCGWHLCSKCEKDAYYMCYTCTFSLCKNCIKDSVIFCVRGKKGFCESCMSTVKLIEDSLKGDKDMVQVDFDDKSSWEYLFKDYYVELKENLSLTLVEISGAKNPWRGSVGKQEFVDDDDRKSNSENSSEKIAPIRRQTRRQTKSRTQERNLRIKRTDNDAKWASKELMEFVMHMNNGERTPMSQFNVHALLLKYITENKLRDPRRKGQVICDERLEKLFGKHRVGHFEMLQLLESHFIAKEVPDGQQETVFDTDEDAGVSEKASKNKKRKIRRKEDRARLANLEEYAAIDAHNINLIYLRRNLLDNLIEDAETFHEKVVGSFVRIRIPGNNQNQELYRLVPVVGTSKTGEPYKIGKRTTDFLLEILNLNKTEVISIAIVSNQEFTEEECKRLRQSVKFGLINRLTVGDIREKAMALQAARVKDWLESETIRLSHLRDRASDLGRRKELRECIEKLQLLKTPEERQRRLEEIPEVHSDPKMDPSNDSEDDESEEDDKRQETYVASRGSGREPISPQKGGSYNSWSSSRSQSRELARILSVNTTKDRESEQERTNPNNARNSSGSGTMSEPVVRAVSETKAVLVSVETPQPAADFSNTDKIWHYQDPSSKIQGPFSINQLRKWNSTGYFPTDLRIWKTTEKQEDSIMLTDALNGNYQKHQNRNPTAASGNNLDSGTSTEVKLTAQNLQSLVQAVRNQTSLMTGSVPVPAQQLQIQGQWSRGGATASTVTDFSSYGMGNQTAAQSHVPAGTNWGYTAVSRGTVPETQTANRGTTNSVFPVPAHVQADVNPVPNWVQPQGTWRNEPRSNPNQMSDRSRVSGGWDRQGGRGYPRTPPGVCRFFFENGHCKKGSSCNYRHS